MLRRVLGKIALCLHFNIYTVGMEELERAQLGIKLEDCWCGAYVCRQQCW